MNRTSRPNDRWRSRAGWLASTALGLTLALAGPALADPVIAPLQGPAEAPTPPALWASDAAAPPAFSYGIHPSAQPGPGIFTLSGRARRAPEFPMLLMDWQLTDRLALTAGRELCTAAGPGAHAIYSLAEHVDLTFGFRFERRRFELAPQPGLEFGGIGVDQSAPAFATLRFGQPHAFVAVVAGAEMRGKLRIEDERGGFIAERLDQPSPFVGFAGRLRF